MSYYVGMDIGAVSITAALLARTAEGGAKPDLPAELFRQAGELDSGELYLSGYRRTRGRPIAAATAILDEIIAAAGAEAVAGVCLTGGASHLVAQELSAGTVNEFKAIALGVAGMGMSARTVFEMGGQSSKYLLLEHTPDGVSIVDYATNGDCAAGTGSFIDQQAGRLRFAVEDVGGLALAAERTAQIAGRCSCLLYTSPSPRDRS